MVILKEIIILFSEEIRETREHRHSKCVLPLSSEPHVVKDSYQYNEWLSNVDFVDDNILSHVKKLNTPEKVVMS